MIGSDVISDVEVLMYVVLSKA